MAPYQITDQIQANCYLPLNPSMTVKLLLTSISQFLRASCLNLLTVHKTELKPMESGLFLLQPQNFGTPYLINKD